LSAAERFSSIAGKTTTVWRGLGPKKLAADAGFAPDFVATRRAAVFYRWNRFHCDRARRQKDAVENLAKLEHCSVTYEDYHLPLVPGYGDDRSWAVEIAGADFVHPDLRLECRLLRHIPIEPSAIGSAKIATAMWRIARRRNAVNRLLTIMLAYVKYYVFFRLTILQWMYNGRFGLR
jgi:hypothetical protein